MKVVGEYCVVVENDVVEMRIGGAGACLLKFQKQEPGPAILVTVAS